MSLKPSDRYATARELADDIEHWLADEPNTAHRETFQERAARWSRAHRTAGMALNATAISALIVGLVAVSAEQRETEKQRLAAENQRIAAEKAQSREAEQRLAAESAKTEEAAQRKLADQRKTDADNRHDEAIATLARSSYFLADARWKAGQVVEARDLPAAVPPEHRHFEWRLACREYQGSDVTLTGHTDNVYSVAFSPDGARLFSEDSSDKRIAWDASTGEQLAAPDPWPDLNGLANRTADGRWLAVPSGKHVLLVDLEFKNTPDEKAYREFKARLDPWWHTEQARAADLNTEIGPVEADAPDVSQVVQQTRDNKPEPDWYSAAFHWAWVVKAYLDKPEKALMRPTSG